MKLSQIAEASRSIEDGEWVNDVDGLPGVRLKTVGFNSVKARKYVQTFLRKQGWHKKRRIDPSEIDVLYANLVADVTAQDWAGIEDDAGPIAFSRDKLAELLFSGGDRLTLNADMRPLLEGWRDAANSVGQLEEDFAHDGDEEKNFVSTSSGARRGAEKKTG